MARFNEKKINKQILELKAAVKKYASEDKGVIGDHLRNRNITDEQIENYFWIPKLCIYLDKCDEANDEWKDFMKNDK